MPIVAIKECICQTSVTSQYSLGKILRYIVFHRTLRKSELDSDLFEGIGHIDSTCLTCAIM